MFRFMIYKCNQCNPLIFFYSVYIKIMFNINSFKTMPGNVVLSFNLINIFISVLNLVRYR